MRECRTYGSCGGRAVMRVPTATYISLARKARRSRATVRDALLVWRDGYEIAPTTIESFISANNLVADHQLATWDAIIVAVAIEAGCSLLLSEDMQYGFTWGGLLVANPFADPVHPMLASLRNES